MPILTQHDCEGGGEAFRISKVSNEEYFSHPAFLTVSAQLHLEALAHAHPRVYSLGPTFRAEPSKTSRHLAEFWMMEAEIAFCHDLEQLLNFVEELISKCIKEVSEKCPEDISHFSKWVDSSLNSRMQDIIEQRPFIRMTYSEAVKILSSASQKFEFTPRWGQPLQSEHENFLIEYCKSPVFVTHYPKSLKPFYMKTTGDVAECFDLLMPKGYEIAGGSLRESNYDTLCKNMTGMEAAYDWYRNLRQFGACPTAGFGLGIERLCLWLTGLESIKDVTAFPRWAGHCKA